MNLQCTERIVQELLTGHFLVIPRFQRPYAWEIEHVDDFWNDAVLPKKDTEYFIGAVVVYREDHDHLGLVDGQQRFTTITMILCAIRDAFKAEKLDELAEGTHQLILRKDINNRDRYVLDTKTSSPYLQDWIQSKDKPITPPAESNEEKRILKAYSKIGLLLNKEIEEARKSKKTDKAKINAVKNRLIAIRSKLLSLRFIYVSLENEDNAYIIFETLNARGLDLRLSDLVKTHLLSKLRQTNSNTDPYRDQWDSMVKEFDKIKIDTSRFLHHHWLSKHPYIAEKKVFKSLRQHVKKSNAKNFHKAILEDSDIYKIISTPGIKKWTVHERKIAGSLEALRIFRVRQPVPMILSLLREYNHSGITRKQLEIAMVAMENFHFVFTAVVSARGSGGIAQMYAKYARGLNNATTKDAKGQLINELKEQLKSSKPDYPEFKANFFDILNSKHYNKQRELARYILSRVHRHNDNKSTADLSLFTIEHLLPQDQAKDSDQRKTIAMLGNQLLIPDALNASLGNKQPASKISLLKRKKDWVDPFILNSSKWSEDMILERTSKLAEQSYDEIWA